MSHVTHMNESCHIGARVFGDGGGETAPDNLHQAIPRAGSKVAAQVHAFICVTRLMTHSYVT